MFAFHLDTRNAARIAPPGQRVVSVEGAFPLELGSEVRLRARQLPLPWAQTWLVRVVALEAPTLIVDELQRGPFAAWRHEHRFAELPGGQHPADRPRRATACPVGALGRIADALFARRLLRATFRSRQQRTRALLGAARA